MGKTIYRIILLTIAVLTNVDMSAYDFEVDGIYYNKLTENTCEVTFKDENSTAYFGNVDIPSSIEFDLQPYNVTSIGTSAFCACYDLTSVSIPNSITHIGENAFRMTGITCIKIPRNVQSIDGNVFRGSSKLCNIEVDNNNEYYDSRDNCNAIIEKSTNTLITGCLNTIIPNSITKIGEASFAENLDLYSIIIPNSVASIGKEAFDGCISLSIVELSNKITSIEDFTFNNCGSLKSICIPESVTNIGEGAFSGCYYLHDVNIPTNVKNIGRYAFSHCNIESVIIPQNVMNIGKGAFHFCISLSSVTNYANNPQDIEEDTFPIYEDRPITLHVLVGCKAAYSAASEWEYFTINDDLTK